MDVVSMYRNGFLVLYSGASNLKMDDEEIALADIDGNLIGANGYGTIHSLCMCGWRTHKHFEIGDDERSETMSQLKHLHTTSRPECKAEVKFREESR